MDAERTRSTQTTPSAFRRAAGEGDHALEEMDPGREVSVLADQRCQRLGRAEVGDISRGGDGVRGGAGTGPGGRPEVKLIVSRQQRKELALINAAGDAEMLATRYARSTAWPRTEVRRRQQPTA